MLSHHAEPEHTVLVGTAGTGTAYGIVRSLVEGWGTRIRLVTADANPPRLLAATALAQHSVQVPKIDDANFVPSLQAILSKFNVDTYFPVHDEEVVLAAELMERGELRDVRFLMTPPADSARRCLDKLECSTWLHDAGLPTPRTVLVESNSEPPQLPCFVKPLRGRGSLGARLVNSIEDWQSALEASSETLIAQELCNGPELTIDTFIDRGRGLLRAVARERLEVKAGVCTKARVFDSPELTDLASKVAVLLDFDGTFCFQVMRSAAEDCWLITDLNPRPGAGARMTVATGVEVLAASFASRWGEDPRSLLPRPTGERIVVRTYVEHVMS